MFTTSEKIVANSLLASEEKREIPNGLECPISGQLMVNPVIANDGHSYEEAYIKEWFERGNISSPVTRLELSNQILIPNFNLKKVIEEYKQKVPLVAKYILDQKEILRKIEEKEKFLQVAIPKEEKNVSLLQPTHSPSNHSLGLFLDNKENQQSPKSQQDQKEEIESDNLSEKCILL